MGDTATSARPASHRDALAAIFRCGAAYAERLPMLPVALERAAIALTEELRALSAQAAELRYRGLDSGHAADLLGSGDGARLAGLLHAAAWDAHLLVSFDRDFIYTCVDLVFGGDGSQPPYAETRPLSRTEVRIADMVLARLASLLERAFAPIAPTSFAAAAELGRADLDRLGGREAPLAMARFRLEAANGGGEMRIAVPDAVLTALKPAFARPPPPGGMGAADPGWTRQMSSEINRTRLAMRAVLEERRRPLAELAALRVGQILPLDATPRSRVRIDCNGEPLLWCEVGQSSGVHTLRVHGFVDREQEFMDGLLSG
ncbi:MAG: FliM/FliN family flagellar motor switch protein [Hyphomicrobiaceae bacterium]|nr:FliM/FliN family flagellar motor switch protein [Hyphomicrobiaceae bacterium]